ncbi:MAG: hypothetical protein RR371_06900, partial [Bacteroides sp.]
EMEYIEGMVMDREILEDILRRAIEGTLECGENPYRIAADKMPSETELRAIPQDELLTDERNIKQLIKGLMNSPEMDYLMVRTLGNPMEIMPKKEAKAVIEDEGITLRVYLNALQSLMEM